MLTVFTKTAGLADKYRAFTEGASVSALDLVGRAPIGGLIQAPKHLTDADIPPHHNLEEGRKFVIKVDWVQSAASPRHKTCLWLAEEA